MFSSTNIISKLNCLQIMLTVISWIYGILPCMSVVDFLAAAVSDRSSGSGNVKGSSASTNETGFDKAQGKDSATQK